jgi:hypothetical protein
MSDSPEVWLRGPVEGVAPVLQPAAHALLQAREDVHAHASGLAVDLLWRPTGSATAGFHLLHLAGALGRLYTYARGAMLDDDQKRAFRAEAVPHPELDAGALLAVVDQAVDAALVQLRSTDPATVFDERKVGRAGLPSTVLGLLFHGAEHCTRHAGQFITTVRMLRG